MSETLLSGIVETVSAIRNLGGLVEGKAKAIDARAVNEMVNLAKGRVPRDTGLLLSGIEGKEEGGNHVFEASAKRSVGGKQQEDYALFVEKGTRGGVAGGRIEAGDAFFAGSGSGRARKVNRTHGGTVPQPFFYNSADEVLEKRGLDLADLAQNAGDDTDFGG